MAFMELQVVHSTWVRWDNVQGEGQIVESDLFTPAQLALFKAPHPLPVRTKGKAHLSAIADALRDYTEGEPDPGTVELLDGWCGRYSAPGYMDRTDWCGPFKTRKEACEATNRLYDEAYE